MFYNDETYAKSVNLILGFKDENSVLFKSELELWKEKFNTIYTLDKGERDGFENGLVTKHLSKLPLNSFKDNYEVIIVDHQ